MTRREESTRYPGIYKRITPTATTYVARWYSADGRRRSATFDKIAEARLHRSAMTQARIRGGRADLSSGRILYRDYFERWYETKNIRGSTANTELAYFRRHIEPYWGNYRIADISPDEIRQWLIMMEAKTVGRGAEERPISRSTIARVYRIFGQPLRQAHKEQILMHDPTLTISYKEGARPQATLLTEPEILGLTAEFPDHVPTIVPFLADSALRIGEALVLQVADLDLDRYEVRVTKTASVTQTGAFVITPPKSARGTRVVPTLTRPVVEALRAQIQDRGAAPGDLIFPGSKGGQLSPGNFRKRIWDPAVRSAGLEERRVTPHSLRHTAVSRWIKARVADPLEISRWAGHASITTTFDIYGHLFDHGGSEMREALERMRNDAKEEGPE